MVLESFTVRDRWDYAVFVVLQQPKPDGSGYFMLAIESSYGSGYAYAWSHPGGCFKSFLCQCDEYYLRSKLAPGTTFDEVATRDAVREHLISLRRDKSIGRDRARELWDSASFDDVSDFHRWQSEGDPDVTDAWEFGRSCPDTRGRDFIGLYEKFWTAFCEQLRASLGPVQEEAQGSSPQV